VRLATAILDRMGVTPRLLLKELGAFGVVGGLAFVVDVGLFQLLYSNGLGAVTAKAISTVVAMTASYVGNRYWSFSHRSRTSVRREFVLFAVINGFTGLLNLGIVALARYGLHQDSTAVLQAANVFGIGVGTVIRYASYRRWVFPGDAAADGEATVDAPSGAAALQERRTVGAGRQKAPEAA
jgi:putative flippase GtrA